MCHRGPGLCYLGFLAAIFNEKIAQQMWLFPDHLTVIRVLFFLISKKIFAIFARIHSEQGGFLKINFFSYITDTLTYSV